MKDEYGSNIIDILFFIIGVLVLIMGGLLGTRGLELASMLRELEFGFTNVQLTFFFILGLSLCLVWSMVIFGSWIISLSGVTRMIIEKVERLKNGNNN